MVGVGGRGRERKGESERFLGGILLSLMFRFIQL